MGEAEDPLAAVLWLLHRVSLLQGVDHSEVADALARIVAVCEGQVGDGWKADPDGIVLERVVQWLLDPLSRNDWKCVADRAAAWLRSLTDGASLSGAWARDADNERGHMLGRTGAVMSEWRGLHNPERHEAFTVGGANPCVSCNILCDSEYPCRCCLQAEVERLTGNWEDAILRGKDLIRQVIDLEAKAKRLTVKIEQVKQAAAESLADRDRRIAAALALLQPDAGGWCDCLAHRIGRALRGESDE
jgi:hypothetical protein